MRAAAAAKNEAHNDMRQETYTVATLNAAIGEAGILPPATSTDPASPTPQVDKAFAHGHGAKLSRRLQQQLGEQRLGLHALVQASMPRRARDGIGEQLAMAPALSPVEPSDIGDGMTTHGALNQHLEEELDPAFACTSKVTVSIPDDLEATMNTQAQPDWHERRQALAAFSWRRLLFDGSWIIVPSMLPHEVEHIDSTIRKIARSGEAIDAPDSSFGTKKFSVPQPPMDKQEWQQGSGGFEPDGEQRAAAIFLYQWRRLFFGAKWVLVPSLRANEVNLLSQQIEQATAEQQEIRRRSRQGQRRRSSMVPVLGDKAEEEIKKMVDDMAHLKKLLNRVDDYTFRSAEKLQTVAMIVVVEAEIAPILAKYGFTIDEELTSQFIGLAKVRSGQIGTYHLHVIKVAESKIFNRHYSGYSQSAAIAALTAQILSPDLVISFGTAGGVPGRCGVGDTVWANGCLFLDRLRTRNKNAFDWGVWGGGCCRTDRIRDALGLVGGPVASQIGYTVSEMQERLIDKAGVYCLDMEAGPIAQILNQTSTNFCALKVISNGVYPGEPRKMEAEYHDHREEVSRRATEVLGKVLDYLSDKTVADL